MYLLRVTDFSSMAMFYLTSTFEQVSNWATSNYGDQGVVVIFEIDHVERWELKGAAWVSYVRSCREQTITPKLRRHRYGVYVPVLANPDAIHNNPLTTFQQQSLNGRVCDQWGISDEDFLETLRIHKVVICSG